jgi:hypothetical protein
LREHYIEVILRGTASIATARKFSVVFCTAATGGYSVSRRVTVAPFGVVTVVPMLVNRLVGVCHHAA